MPLQMKFVREGDAFAFSAVPDSAPTQDPFASGTVRHLGACKLRRVDLRALLEKHRSRRLEFGSEGQNPKQARHIEFGPRWRSLRWVAFGEGDALSLSELREEFAAEVQDFESHPALLDTAVGSAMYAIHRYEDSQDLYVPVFFGRTTLFGRLPGKCYCHIRPAQTNVDRGEVASFDLTLIAEDGTVVAEIEQFSLRRLGSGALLGGGAAEAADAAKPASAITPSSGASVLAAILASGQTPQVVVVPAGQDIGKKREQTVLKKARVERADGGGADGPRDDVEERLAEWWRDLLGIDRVGIREGFFELGGHSLLAVRLLARIEKEFGRKIPLNVLFQSGTIEALAGCIRGPNSERTGAVVPMTGPAGMPFYCIPPIGGDIAGLWNLAKPLRPDVAFYGIQAPPDQRTPVFASSIEGMAAFFVHDLVAAHPDGPYNLGGWSAGAVIALEMAQQLRASGREVGLVVSIDGAPYNTNAETPRYNPVFYWKLLRNVPRWVRDDLMVDFSWRTSYKRAGRKMAAFAAELRDKFRPGSTSGLPRVSGFMDVAEFSSEQIEFMNAVAGALRRYAPKAYPGRVIVYQAVTEPLHHLFEVDRVWRHLASEVEVVRVPGNHVSLMQPASARAIAAHLWRRLETVPESAKSGFQAASQPGI